MITEQHDVSHLRCNAVLEHIPPQCKTVYNHCLSMAGQYPSKFMFCSYQWSVCLFFPCVWDSLWCLWLDTYLFDQTTQHSQLKATMVWHTIPQFEISNHSSIYYATIPCMPCIIYHMIPYQPIACTFVTIYFYNNNNIAPWRCDTAPFNCNTVITTPPSKPYHVPSDRTPHRTLRPYPTPYHRTFRTLVWAYLILTLLFHTNLELS